MNEASFKNLLAEHIAPMFSGCTVITEAPARRSSAKRAMLADPQHIKVRWSNTEFFQFNLKRSQEFSQQDAAFVNDVIMNLNEIAPVEATSYFEEMIGAAVRRAVATQAARNFTDPVNQILRELEQWSEETYEGRPISAALGITPNAAAPNAVALRTLLATSFSRVATGNLDAVATVNSDGSFAGYESLPPPKAINTIMAPQRFAPIAQWSNAGKVGLVLSRNGEILVFRNGELGFARRRGRWRQFNHRALITRIGLNRVFVKPLCTAVYLSCLDVSFAKVGGGIGLVAPGKIQALNADSRVDVEDSLAGTSAKAKFLNQAIRGRKFQDLERPLRQTLLGMDGSTVIQRDGSIIAVGAIIKVEAGSKTGGGRKAAAITFGKYGIGIKVSSDGEIAGFNKNTQVQEPLLTFG
jgi:hypothetical protein